MVRKVHSTFILPGLIFVLVQQAHGSYACTEMNITGPASTLRGEITTPNYPNPYPYQTEFCYIINNQLPDASYAQSHAQSYEVLIQLEDIDLPMTGSGMTYNCLDTLTITYGFPNGSVGTVPSICDKSHIQTVWKNLLITSYLRVDFKSNHPTPGRGFKIGYMGVAHAFESPNAAAIRASVGFPPSSPVMDLMAPATIIERPPYVMKTAGYPGYSNPGQEETFILVVNQSFADTDYYIRIVLMDGEASVYIKDSDMSYELKDTGDGSHKEVIPCNPVATVALQAQNSKGVIFLTMPVPKTQYKCQEKRKGGGGFNQWWIFGVLPGMFIATGFCGCRKYHTKKMLAQQKCQANGTISVAPGAQMPPPPPGSYPTAPLGSENQYATQFGMAGQNAQPDAPPPPYQSHGLFDQTNSAFASDTTGAYPKQSYATTS